jgi:hypothetical protein
MYCGMLPITGFSRIKMKGLRLILLTDKRVASSRAGPCQPSLLDSRGRILIGNPQLVHSDTEVGLIIGCGLRGTTLR